MAWYKRIRDLREDSDKTQTDIAEVLETATQYYGKYEKGERELPFNRAIQLADYYGISLDYLAGRSDFRTSQPLNDDEKSLLNNWRTLSERNKGKVEYLITALLDEQAQQKEAR
ncbi:MAG: helix-turn-helix transcriptional regulator [Ruminococcus sp.]|nr:helix-turn-helix transcriptional regulator [Ruminococcus sp.]